MVDSFVIPTPENLAQGMDIAAPTNEDQSVRAAFKNSWGQPRLSQLPIRMMLFVAVGAVGFTLDIMARASLKAADVHPLFRHWWLFPVLFVAAGIVRPFWGAGLAGLTAGGTLALSVNDEMQVIGGIAWSPAFVFAFAGAISICVLLTVQLIWIIPATFRKRLEVAPQHV